jgi:hypothetical protein
VETAAATSARMAVARERTKWLTNVLMAVMPQTNIKQKGNDTKTKRTNTHKEHIKPQNQKTAFARPLSSRSGCRISAATRNLPNMAAKCPKPLSMTKLAGGRRNAEPRGQGALERKLSYRAVRKKCAVYAFFTRLLARAHCDHDS